ncbi:hypothetical protein ACFV3N_13255 [Streptomyces bauhiniae]|uniref:hypothetical protein n=1 Tax=Streptomyces bauhiniae TaxID=2340725 RepID=UPI0036617720
MSRETDTPSSGPNGRGGAAYPSGTPPYGTPMASGDGTGAGSPDARPEERKTETTLTTRIRINIPGSRPIPPVVVRKTVDGAPAGESGGDEPAADARPEPAAPPAPEPAAEPAPQAEEKTSDWFAPRKSGAPKGGSGGGGTNGAGMPGGTSAPRTGAPALGPGPSAQRPAAPAPNAPRPGGTNGSGMSGATGGPVAPGHGGGTGSFDVTEALASGPRGGTRPDEPARDDLPFFSDNGGAPAGGPGAPGANGRGGPGGPNGFNGPGGQGAPGPNGPTGPTGGPVTGDGPLPTRPVPGNAPGAPGMRGMEPGEPFDGPPAFRAPGGGPPKSAQSPQGGQGPQTPQAPQPGNPLGDDTAILTPQQLAAAPGAPGRAPHGTVSGHTVTSGIPVFPGDEADPFGPTPGADRPAYTAPKPPAPQAKATPQPKKKKGRSKLMLLVAGVVVIVGGAYGAGLLMNRTDVPKGTTVLGVDIGGGTRDDAVKKLDDAFRDRVNKPLQLSVGGGNVALTPDKAGLQFDYQATVSDAATSDYNPLSVIGSLFGRKRVVPPVTPVDEEKLQVALQQAGGGSGSVVEGGIKFESGKAVPVYGKPGKAIDAAGSTKAVEQAYRTLIETGTATPVTVPSTTQQPTVPNAEVDREMKAFAEPAMSNIVTVQVDAAHSINFGPKSLPKILGFKAVGGKLTDTYNLEALKAAYGTTFEGVKVESATGKRDVLPQDVVAALRKALVGKTAAERIGTIDTKPN